MRGIHTPLITKELFDETRNSIKTQVTKSQGKEFAFTRIMKCGVCGSGITADEKFKKLKAGGVNRHVYYRCTKSRDRKCKNKALNETDLIGALVKMFDTLSLNKVKLNAKLDDEIQKFKKLQAMFLGKKRTEKIESVDLRDYAKFVLREGTILEVYKNIVATVLPNGKIKFQGKETSLSKSAQEILKKRFDKDWKAVQGTIFTGHTKEKLSESILTLLHSKTKTTQVSSFCFTRSDPSRVLEPALSFVIPRGIEPRFHG